MVNIAAKESKPHTEMRFGLAEAYGCVAVNHFDIVIEKILDCLSSGYWRIVEVTFCAVKTNEHHRYH